MTWWAWVAAGTGWVAVVALILFLSLTGAETAAEEGVIDEPTTFQVGIAVVSGIVFAVPGVVMIAVGLRRRPSDGPGR